MSSIAKFEFEDAGFGKDWWKCAWESGKLNGMLDELISITVWRIGSPHHGIACKDKG